MLTLKKINKALKEAGAKEELVRANGYLYFQGGNAARWPTSMATCHHINQWTLEMWVNEWRHLSSFIDY